MVSHHFEKKVMKRTFSYSCPRRQTRENGIFTCSPPYVFCSLKSAHRKISFNFENLWHGQLSGGHCTFLLLCKVKQSYKRVVAGEPFLTKTSKCKHAKATESYSFKMKINHMYIQRFILFRILAGILCWRENSKVRTAGDSSQIASFCRPNVAIRRLMVGTSRSEVRRRLVVGPSQLQDCLLLITQTLGQRWCD